MMTLAISNGLLNTSSGVDSWGHLGGFLTGIVYSIAFYPPALDLNKKLDTKIRTLSKVLLVIMILSLTVLVFFKPLSLCQPESICKNIC